MHHQLKTDREVFFASWEGVKEFEIRYNDRDFKAGDKLTLKETVHTGEEMKAGAPLVYTGREIDQEIDYVLYGGYGLKDGWVVIGASTRAYREEPIQ